MKGCFPTHCRPQCTRMPLEHCRKRSPRLLKGACHGQLNHVAEKFRLHCYGTDSRDTLSIDENAGSTCLRYHVVRISLPLCSQCGKNRHSYGQCASLRCKNREMRHNGTHPARFLNLRLLPVKKGRNILLQNRRLR